MSSPSRCAQPSVSHVVARNNVLSDNTVCATASWLLINNGIHRFSNWRRYADECVGEDAAFLHRFVVDDNRDNEQSWPWTRPPIVERAMRALFRLQFFMHGFSHRFSFSLASHMFYRRTERTFICRDTGIVRMRTLDDRVDDDDDDDDVRGTCPYTLFSDLVPLREMRAIKHCWTVLRHVWRERCLRGEHEQNDARQPVDEAIRLLITLYASWAYGAMSGIDEHETRAVLSAIYAETDDADPDDAREATLAETEAERAARQEASSQIDARIVAELYENPENALTLQTFLREYGRLGYLGPRKIQAPGYITSLEVALTIVRQPSTPFARTVVKVVSEDALLEHLAAFVDLHVHMFPARTIKPQKPPKSWFAVRRINGTTETTVPNLRAILRGMREDAQQRLRSRPQMPPPPLSSPPPPSPPLAVSPPPQVNEAMHGVALPPTPPP